ncbi:MAG TPA: hypothetical protein VFK02_18020 [Kofleriaceae bacterium]|nr:hypothetical protein [Kofleriaceae bacterium]
MSAYAIAEVQRHVRDFERACQAPHRDVFRRDYWHEVKQALQERGVHEHHVRWTELDEELVRDYGPADASLVALTRDLTRQRQQPCMITADRQLRHRCSWPDLELRARDPDELLSLIDG